VISSSGPNWVMQREKQQRVGAAVDRWMDGWGCLDGRERESKDVANNGIPRIQRSERRGQEAV
jgi:hypothetical protein